MTLRHISRMSPAEASAREQARDHENTAAGYFSIAAVTVAVAGAVSLYRGTPPVFVAAAGGLVLLLGLAAAGLELREARRLRKHADMLAGYMRRERGRDRSTVGTQTLSEIARRER